MAREETLTPPVALTIAGFDPSSGAGITADLKTFAAHGVFGLSAITALTVQSTTGVRRVVPLEGRLITETLYTLVEDISLDGVKIGMLGNAEVAREVAVFLKAAGIPRERIVLDPVVRSSSGAALLHQDGLRLLKERLLPQVGWVTPNGEELAVLTGSMGPIEKAGIPEAAGRLRQFAEEMGNRELRVVVTGGHFEGPEGKRPAGELSEGKRPEDERPDDYFLPALNDQQAAAGWVRGEWVRTRSTHGTGCAFSSALLCAVLQGGAGRAAVEAAKQYVQEALAHAYPVGKGHGPMHHLYRLDR